MKDKILMTIMLIVIIGLAIYNVYATQPSPVEIIHNRITKNEAEWREKQTKIENLEAEKQETISEKLEIEKQIQSDREKLLGKVEKKTLPTKQKIRKINKKPIFKEKTEKALQKKIDKERAVFPGGGKKILLKGWKLERALYLQKIAIEKGFSKEQTYWLIAQIMQESGFNNETKGDGGCSRTLVQWNVCARGKLPHTEWRKMLHVFVNEIWDRYQKYGNFRRAQVGWNNPRAWRNGKYKTKYYYEVENRYYKIIK